MHFDLKSALRGYRRMRAWRHIMIMAVVPAAFILPWTFDLNRTESIICGVGALVVAMTGHLEMRLKTMQIRLAGMADELDALRGKEDQGNLILELNDW
jgi:hypothetical protein